MAESDTPLGLKDPFTDFHLIQMGYGLLPDAWSTLRGMPIGLKYFIPALAYVQNLH